MVNSMISCLSDRIQNAFPLESPSNRRGHIESKNLKLDLQRAHRNQQKPLHDLFRQKETSPYHHHTSNQQEGKPPSDTHLQRIFQHQEHIPPPQANTVSVQGGTGAGVYKPFLASPYNSSWLSKL